MARWRTMVAMGACIAAASTGAACTRSTAGVALSTTTTVTIDGATPNTTTPNTTTPNAATIDTATSDTGPATDPGLPLLWARIAAPVSCQCSDGSGFHFFIHRNDPTKVVFFLEGGGACFSAETCGPSSTSYRRSISHPDDLSDVSSGIFDFSDPRNPFSDWSIVFVPYCTGDMHLGNTTQDYGGGVVVHHDGYLNGTTALGALMDFFPKAEQLVVAGESAGSAATPLYAGLAHDKLPQAHITVLADGSGAYPDETSLNSMIGAAWGTERAIPDWPENRGLTAATWSIPGLFAQTHRHAPHIVFARHDYAFDIIQNSLVRLLGLPATDLLQMIDTNEQHIESTGATLLSYISPGNGHTVLGRPDFYTETENGTPLVQWVTDLVAGRSVADVHCTNCT